MLSRFKERRIDILDLKCGDFASMIRDLPGFEDPVRVKDDGWVGAILDRQNETAIKKAFDYAFKLAMNGETNNIAQDQYLYIPLDDSEHEYQSQPIRLRNNNFNKKPLATDRIHRMQELYDYSVLPSVGRYKNFYNQGKFMADYEDDYSDYAAFRRFYPTYHDMKIEQLRSYFACRTQLRKGNYQKVSTSYAYVYIYELLNNIGVKSAQDGYQKLIDFKENYVEKFDLSIEPYLNDWLKDYVLFYELDQKLIEENFEDGIAQDHDYIVLHDPESFSAKELAEVFARKTSYWNTSKTIKNNSEVFAKVLRSVWQELLLFKKYGIVCYSAFVAKPETVKRKVFLASIFYSKPKKLPVQLIDLLRKYRYNNGYWQIRKYTEAKKDLGVDIIISDSDWYEYLKLFASFFRQAGYAGLMIMIDELVNIYKIPNTISRQYNYEKILTMYNDTLQGKAKYLGIIMCGTPQAIEDRCRSVYSYEALRSRLASGKFTQVGARDMYAPVVKLEPLTAEEMMVLKEKLADMHANLYGYERTITDDDLMQFIKIEYARVGADTNITPREIIRDFIEILDIVWQNPDTKIADLLNSD